MKPHMANIAVAIIGSIAAVAGAFYTASAASDVRVNEVNTKVEVLQERQGRQYDEVKSSLDRIENKLDSLK